jgi:hypothetical protein
LRFLAQKERLADQKRAAATHIQARLRCLRAKRMLQHLRHERHMAMRAALEKRTIVLRHIASAHMIQRQYRWYRQLRQAQRAHAAAIKIQCCRRQYRARQDRTAQTQWKLMRQSQVQCAAIVIQSRWRGCRGRQIAWTWAAQIQLARAYQDRMAARIQTR